MKPSVLNGLVLMALTAQTPLAGAEPRNTAWLEDAHVEPRGGTETGFLFEYQAADFKALEQGFRLVTANLPAGVGDACELVPHLQLRQRSDESALLRELGLDFRARLLGTPAAPLVLAYAGYANDLTRERDHHLRVGGVARYGDADWFASADVRVSSGLGGQLDASWETWLGVAGGYSFLPNGEIGAGLEVFVITPLTGPRLSDPVFGEAAESTTLYYGPLVSTHLGPFWSTAGVATGFAVSEPASELLVRWSVGVGAE